MFSDETSGHWTAVLGDWAGSRSVPERRWARTRLVQAIEDANDRLGLPRRIETGEPEAVRALLPQQSDRALDVVVEITERVHPAPIAFGLGGGPLESESPPRGDCVENAREALERARKKHRWVSVRGFGEREDPLLDALFHLMGSVRRRWTERQCEVVRAARTEPVRKRIAAMLGVSPSVVTEALQAAGFDAIVEGERAARTLLARKGRPAA